MVTYIDRLSRGLTYGLQVIEDLHHAGVEFRSLSEDFDTANGQRQAPARDGACLQRVVAELDQRALGRRPSEGAGRGPFPWQATAPDRAAAGVHQGGTVEGSEPAGTGQATGGQPLDHPTGGRVGVVGIAVFTRIPCVVQVGRHYSTIVAQYLGAIDRNCRPARSRTTHHLLADRRQAGPPLSSTAICSGDPAPAPTRGLHISPQWPSDPALAQIHRGRCPTALAPHPTHHAASLRWIWVKTSGRRGT